VIATDLTARFGGKRFAASLLLPKANIWMLEGSKLV
jgi:hypothetical protein